MGDISLTQKGNELGFVALGNFLLFDWFCERIVTEILHNLRVMRNCGKNLVAFPTAEANRANSQSASGFLLKNSQLEASFAKMTADSRRLSWDLNATVSQWQILAP